MHDVKSGSKEIHLFLGNVISKSLACNKRCRDFSLFNGSWSLITAVGLIILNVSFLYVANNIVQVY